MNSLWKRMSVLVVFAAIIAVISTNAFALGKSKKSGYHGWQQSSDNAATGGGVITDNTGGDNNGGGEPSGDANPVPEPASLVLLGSALAGLGGYRGLRKRMARR